MLLKLEAVSLDEWVRDYGVMGFKSPFYYRAAQASYLNVVRNPIYDFPKNLIIRNRGKNIIFQTYRDIAAKRNKMFQTPYTDPATNRLRFLYTQYADDFVILGNFGESLALAFKQELKARLWDKRRAKLSDLKTCISMLKKKPANFLGFEIKATNHRKLTFVKRIDGSVYKQRTAGWILYIGPDKIRMVNKLFMKGYCNRKGFPISIPWLATFEPHILIKKFNDVMTGFAEYYCDFITNKAHLNRWLYIIRFSKKPLRL